MAYRIENEEGFRKRRYRWELEEDEEAFRKRKEAQATGKGFGPGHAVKVLHDKPYTASNG